MSATAAMPLFFFHLRTDAGLERDEVGTPFPDLEAAYLDACRAIPEMVSGLLGEGRDPMRCAFAITDERGRALMEVPFSERLTRPAGRPGPASDGAMVEAVSRLSETASTEARALRDAVRRTRREIARTAEITRTPFLDLIARRYRLDEPDPDAD